MIINEREINNFGYLVGLIVYVVQLHTVVGKIKALHGMIKTVNND